MYSPVSNNREGCPTDNLNINKRGVGGGAGGFENCVVQIRKGGPTKNPKINERRGGLLSGFY